MSSKNVLGTELVPCSYDPLTGYFRDGCCNTDDSDRGSHLVCVRVTPLPQHRFAGLKPGDRWCLCANRWREALEVGAAPPVILESTHLNALAFVTIEQLEKHRFLGALH